MPSRSRGVCRVLPAASLLLSLAALGCGSNYPVRGKVTYEDGTPLSGGLVVFERKDGDKITMARGDIQPDGRYQLGTHKPGDGVPPGKYRVLVTPLLDINAPAPERDLPIDKRYLDFNTSGLEFEVRAGENEFPIRVTKPGKRPG